MIMRWVRTSRSDRSDLLTRPPCGVQAYEDRVRSWIVDPVEQLAELADLLQRGLLSREEFERHKAKVIDTRDSRG
jgi:hypothetical protein